MAARVQRVPSISIVGTRAPELEGLPRFRAYGEVDDHLRLSILLADRLEGQGDPEAAKACKAADLTWPQRKERLREFLGTLRPQASGRVAGFVDPDALHPGEIDPETSWDDAEFRKERLDVFRMLIESAQEGGWVFLRPAPKVERAIDMAEFQSLSEPLLRRGKKGLGKADLSSARAALAPALRPLLDWLLADKVLEERYAVRILESAPHGNPSLDILELAYDHLRPSLREVAKRLSILRAEQPVNGHLGAYELAAEKLEYHSIPGNAVESLQKAGFLQPGSQPATLVSPTSIRLFLLERAEVSMAEQLEKEHRWLGQQVQAPSDVEQWTEAHYHAVRGGDLEQAEKTATFYGSDLRGLAVRWSHEGRYEEAARIFHRVVEQYDSEDAYAWEYLGLNLALAHRNPSPQIRTRIREAYEKAWKLAPNNPLYHGRYVGFRARWGEPVQQEIHRALAHYRSTGGPTAFACFGNRVVDMLQKGNAQQKKAAQTLINQWPALKPDKRQD
jgi:tetratricopeptide (TPR) repeat protein